jgi:hypothetical protein
MWAISKNGFISAVEYRPRKDSTHQLPKALQPVGPNATRNEKRRYAKLTRNGFILARARVREDLDQLAKYFPQIEIKEDRGADYKFRCVLPRAAFAQWAFDAAFAIDYDSHFKEVAKEFSPPDPNRYSAMMTCWGALNTMGRPAAPKFQSTYSGSRAGTGRSYDWDQDSRSPFGYNPASKDRDNLDAVIDSVLAEPRVRDEVQLRAAATDTLAGMLAALQTRSVASVGHDTDELTPDGPWDMWVQASDLFEGQDTPLDNAQAVELLETMLAEIPAERQGDDDPAEMIRLLEEAKQDKADDAELGMEPPPRKDPVGTIIAETYGKSPCVVAGRHLSYTKHSADECVAHPSGGTLAQPAQ